MNLKTLRAFVMLLLPTAVASSALAENALAGSADSRPHVVFMIGEREYNTKDTLPVFAREQLETRGMRCTFIHADLQDKNSFPGLQVLKTADLLVLSVRRRSLPREQLDLVRQYLTCGKPLVGIRTASHAFHTLGKHPKGHQEWQSFDHDVLGGNYRNHLDPNIRSVLKAASEVADHTILADVSLSSMAGNGSLYQVSPLSRKANPLVIGSIPNHSAEPVAWTHQYGDSRVFYTSLGHPEDFKNEGFKRLLVNAVFWALNKPVPAECAESKGREERPNIVLCMTDDQGWGDTGYNGHELLKTPVMDEMAASGLRFNRFYAATPLCSSTRGSLLTGRHPNRFGCFSANMSIRPEEITLAEALKKAGYATGHFGKWHLGPVKAGTPINPGASGFDQWLSHDNWFDLNPELSRNGQPPRTVEGESSEVVVDAALRFIREQAAAKKPFLAVVWFASPHDPHKPLDSDRLPYRDLSVREQNYLGEIAGVDRALGTLRRTLRSLGIAGETLLWFNSDNGPTAVGSTGGLRGMKTELWEGGIRVPGIIEWPAQIRKPFATDIPCGTIDIYPTILDILGLQLDEQIRPIDGTSLLPLIEGRMHQRPEPMAFWKYVAGPERHNEAYLDADDATGWWRTFRNNKHPNAKTKDFGGHAALIGNRYKLHKLGKSFELYDILADSAERKDLASEKPEVVTHMKEALETWQASVEKSLSGLDYPNPGEK